MKEDSITSTIEGVIPQASLIITLILQHTLQEKVGFITQKITTHDTCEVNCVVSSITMYNIM
jgi:hypothetical protein